MDQLTRNTKQPHHSTYSKPAFTDHTTRNIYEENQHAMKAILDMQDQGKLEQGQWKLWAIPTFMMTSFDLGIQTKKGNQVWNDKSLSWYLLDWMW